MVLIQFQVQMFGCQVEESERIIPEVNVSNSTMTPDLMASSFDTIILIIGSVIGGKSSLTNNMVLDCFQYLH